MSQCNNYENNVQRLPFGLITIKKKNCPKYCFKCHSFLKIINVSCTLCPAGLVVGEVSAFGNKILIKYPAGPVFFNYNY